MGSPRDSSSLNAKRSRGGCERCRRRRQKCDEMQPFCSRCREADITCSYKVNVRWGGRDFTRSPFGTCGVRKIELEPGRFVYTAKEDSGIHNPAPRSLPELPGVDAEVQSLIHYFIQQGSASISTHRQIQEETCRVLVPAAVESPALLHAISAFAAAQQASYTTNTFDRMRLKVWELQSRTRSIKILHEGMANSAEFSPVVVMGSSLMLCLCALFCDNDDYNSWRIYLCGAKAAFPAACSVRGRSSTNEGLAEYLRKRYLLLEVVAMLSTNSFEALDMDSNGSAKTRRQSYPQPQSPSPEIFLDDHVACYTDLFNLLRVVGAIAWERRQLQKHGDLRENNLLSDADFEVEADNLEAQVYDIMERTNSAPPVMLPRVKAVLEPRQVEEFSICNQVYECYALLRIRTEIKCLEPHEPCVQELVQKIIELVARIQPRPGLSPALGLNTALFSAGQYALAEKRTAIRRLLEHLYAETHNRNLILSIRSLEAQFWGQQPVTSTRIDLHSHDFIAY